MMVVHTFKTKHVCWLYTLLWPLVILAGYYIRIVT